MSINKADLKNKTKKRRPLGVWVLTIYAFLYVGIYQLHPTTTLNLLRGHTAMFSDEDIPVLIVYAFLKISITIVSVLTWGGSEIGRKSFLLFVLLYFLGDGIYKFSWGTQIPDLGVVRSWISYLSDFAFPLLCIWYFNRPSTKEFFRRVEKDVIER